MKGLQGLLIRKIAITGIFWCLPLLLFPASWFVRLGMPSPEPMLYPRLLGAAYLALLVGYYMGLVGLRRGERPHAVINMGLTSNGLACALLTGFGVTGAWSTWGLGAQVFMWASTVGALAMTTGLMHFKRRLGGNRRV